MEMNQQHTSEIRKGIIRLLMFSLYSDEKTIYREYVQNALDSINQAVQDRVLNQSKDGIVNIHIESDKISIRDNGTGITIEDAPRILLDVSSSSKNGVDQAGLFGIGRLVGGGYCHKLEFRTTAKGQSEGTIVTFNIDEIEKMVVEDKEDYLASYVLTKCTIVERFPVEESEHFFEVTLKKIKTEMAPTLTNSQEIIDYLCAVAPVEYKPQFSNVLIYKSTENNQEFKSLHEGLEKVQVFVGKTRIQKKYGLRIEGTKDEINNLEYFKIENEDYGMLGWGWFALTKYTIQIPKEDKLACIRLRIHNIQIGDYNQLSGSNYWKEERGNSYFYGEFFVTHPNIKPNGARDGLSPTPEAKALVPLLHQYFENLKTLYTRANEAKKSIDKIVEGAEKFKKTKNIDDYNANDLVDNKGIGKFDKLVKGATFAPIKRMLQLYQPSFEEAKHKVEAIKNELLSNTKVQETETDEHPHDKEDNFTKPKVVKDTNTIIGQIPEIKQDGNSEQKNSYVINSAATTNSHPDISDIDVLSKIKDVATVTPAFTQQDIISPLYNVLDADEIWTIRRIFRVLNTYCPKNDHDQKLITEMERLIVKEFQNA